MDKNKTKKLVFIYNAASGLRNAFLDSAHKIISPKTYNCNLCDITFGVFKEHAIWKNFRKGSGLDMEFLHKDEFQKQYASKFGYAFTFPIVLVQSAYDLEVLITTEELNTLRAPQELIDLITSRTG
ncbi:MAG: GTPase [Muriicola sp.]|nr:GTPase [Muriicola sp.]